MKWETGELSESVNMWGTDKGNQNTEEEKRRNQQRDDMSLRQHAKGSESKGEE